MAVDGVLDRRPHAVVVGDVERGARGPAAGGGDRGDGVGAVGDVSDDDGGALAGEQLGGDATEPARRTGDERDLVLEPAGHVGDCMCPPSTPAPGLKSATPHVVRSVAAGPVEQATEPEAQGGDDMAWDFSTDPEFQEKLDWVDQFCREKVEPLDYVLPYAIRSPDPTVKAYVRKLQQEVKDQGLWAIFLDEELGGPGFGQLKLGLLNEIIGRYGSAPQLFGAAAPDTGNMEILAAYGTEEQKKRWLEPLLNQDMFSAYSMTEPQGGSDPNLFKTYALRDGDEWVINGEKWFTSAGRVADLLFVMCTNGMFVVPRETPGVEIMPEPRNHNHIIYRDVRVPLDHLLGPEDGAKVLAQRRLGGGRIHHAMRTIAQCHLAFDMMCERALSRESHGKIIAEHQMVQEKIAESYASIKMLRLLVLEAAWKIDQTSTQEARTEIVAVKFTMARVLREVSFNALHILGSLGTTDLTPIQAMYAAAPTMGIADGVDEVHMATVARRVLKGYRPHEGYFPTEFIPYKREEAWKKMEPVFAANPDLRESAERYKKYLAGRRR